MSIPDFHASLGTRVPEMYERHFAPAIGEPLANDLLRAAALQPGERVLDVGCGWGSNLLYLAQHTQGVFQGITLSAQQREEALARARAWGVADRVRIDVCHVEDLELEANSVDAVLFSGSIVHMHNRPAVHELVGKILKPLKQAAGASTVTPGTIVTAQFQPVHRLMEGEPGATPLDKVIAGLTQVHLQLQALTPGFGNNVDPNTVLSNPALRDQIQALQMDSVGMPPMVRW